MRRGRYGNRVSFRVTLDTYNDTSIEELRQAIEKVIILRTNPTAKVHWPADYHGRPSYAQEDMDSRKDMDIISR
jgi:hypothetical protein